jgi:HEAT repeat protein
MHWYQYPGRWLRLISDQGRLEVVAMELLTSENLLAQENAVFLAKDLKLESAVPELLRALESPNLSVRRAASATLASIGSQAVAESLLQLSQDERKALIAIDAFSNLPVNVATPVFETYFSGATLAERKVILKHLDTLLQRSVLEQRGTRSREIVVQCANVVLRSAESEIFGMALLLFEDARLDSAADCLMKFALSNAPRNRRIESVLTLGSLRTPRAIECLERLSSREEEGLREGALRAVRELLASRRRWTSEDAQVRHMAAEMLIASEDKSSETLTLLLDLTKDSDERIRSLVLQGLDRFFGSNELPGILEPNFIYEDEGVRKDSLDFLERKGICTKDELFERLYQCLDITRTDILSAVICELDRYGSAKHRPLFVNIKQRIEENLSKESSPGVQAQYRNALTDLKEIIEGL